MQVFSVLLVIYEKEKYNYFIVIAVTVNLCEEKTFFLLTKTKTSQMSHVRPLMFPKKKGAPKT